MKRLLSHYLSPRARVTFCAGLLLFAVACGSSSSSTTAPGSGGGCQIITGQTTTTFGASGGNAAISVTTAATCPWTASSSQGFLTVTQGGSGMGSGNVQFTVAANTGAQRSAILTITGTPITITQSAP